MSEQQDISPEIREALRKAHFIPLEGMRPWPVWVRHGMQAAGDWINLYPDKGAAELVAFTVPLADLPALLRYKETATELAALKVKMAGGDTT